MAERIKQNMLSALDFCIEVFKEKIDGKGEDSFFYSVEKDKAAFGVFDGCGGSGARRYEKLQGKTGAYMASRVISGATKDWFEALPPKENGVSDVEALKQKMQEYLGICKREGETASAIKGKLSRSFPTTAALIVCTPAQNRIRATCIWAGDSRCYMLDESGLMQLTEDDISGLDAMENLTADGVLTNVISASDDIRLHTKHIDIDKPCLLFAATDGCFGYLPTPMEFEFMLIDTLLKAESVERWESKLKSQLQNIAGDDFSLCGGFFGYGTLENLKDRLKSRRNILLSEYINGLESKTAEEKTSLWRKYAVDYSRYLNRRGEAERSEFYSSTVVDEASANETIIADTSAGEPQENVTETAAEENIHHGFKKPTDLD